MAQYSGAEGDTRKFNALLQVEMVQKGEGNDGWAECYPLVASEFDCQLVLFAAANYGLRC